MRRPLFLVVLASLVVVDAKQARRPRAGLLHTPHAKHRRTWLTPACARCRAQPVKADTLQARLEALEQILDESRALASEDEGSLEREEVSRPARAQDSHCPTIAGPV